MLVRACESVQSVRADPGSSRRPQRSQGLPLPTRVWDLGEVAEGIVPRMGKRGLSPAPEPTPPPCRCSCCAEKGYVC